MGPIEIETKLRELEEWVSLMSCQKYPGAKTLDEFKKSAAEFAKFRIEQERESALRQDKVKEA